MSVKNRIALALAVFMAVFIAFFAPAEFKGFGITVIIILIVILFIALAADRT